GEFERVFFIKTEEFERVFFIKTAPLPTWSGGVLYRSFPDDWILGVPRKIGPPKALLTTKRKPTLEEMDVALRGEQVGPPKVLLTTARKPSLEEMDVALCGEQPSLEEMDVALRGEQVDDLGTPDILKGFPNPFDIFK
ncbi:hypothetical protein T484DRAFT_1803989, partial [Baffinella frigidus]